MPLITCEQVPHIPSRQSWSKTIVSFPSITSSSLTSSSISRKDISGLMFFALYSCNFPGSFGPFWRHTNSVRSIICNSLFRDVHFQILRAPCGAPAPCQHPGIPKLLHSCNSRHRVLPLHQTSGTQRGSVLHMTHCDSRHRGPEAPRIQENLQPFLPFQVPGSSHSRCR